MSTVPPNRSHAIIGVVGSTFTTNPRKLKPDNELPDEQRGLVQRAQEVGRLLAAQHIVLTGGHHTRPETSVKYRALVGAAEVGGGRVIGMLPDKISEELKVDKPHVLLELKEPPVRSLYVHTQLTSPQRNGLTGNAVDALIALAGETGTASEVDAARAATPRRPVVFLRSWSVLQPLLACPPANPILAETAPEAVMKALDALGVPGGAPRLEGRLPDTYAEYNDVSTYLSLKRDYEQKLQLLDLS